MSRQHRSEACSLAQYDHNQFFSLEDQLSLTTPPLAPNLIDWQGSLSQGCLSKACPFAHWYHNEIFFRTRLLCLTPLPLTPNLTDRHGSLSLKGLPICPLESQRIFSRLSCHALTTLPLAPNLIDRHGSLSQGYLSETCPFAHWDQGNIFRRR